MQRWNAAIALDPYALFELAGESYLDYYYALFEERGEAAHGLGAHSLRMTRKAAVRAQTFAHIVLLEYFRKHSLPIAEASLKLGFNKKLLRQAARDWMTKLTRAENSGTVVPDLQLPKTL